MTLANGIGGALVLGGLFVGLLSLVVAVVIETPVLWLWWRRRSVWRWVLGANIASLALGILPAILWNIAPSPGESVNPWEWHQTVAGKVLVFSGAVFVMTVLVEGAFYVWMNRKAGASLSARRIAIATLTTNAISYMPMVAYLVTQARSTGDFELLPDATWVTADDTRVYFVDQASDTLHSIRLDGSDRRVELNETLGRFEGEVEHTAFYALLDDDPRILFVAPDRYWHVFDGESDHRLSIALPEYHGRAHPGDVAISLQVALAEIGITRPLPTGDQSLDGVYLSSSTRFDWTRKSRTLKEYQIASGMTPYSGAGRGLVFWDEDVPKTLTFRVWAGFLSLACNNPAVLPDENTVVFRCGDSIMVMDFAKRRVGRLVRGDSLAIKLPQFSEGDWRVYAR